MDRSFDVDSVLQGKADTATLLRRGLAKRCPRCGGGGLYRGWFHMAERCPTCGYRFEREPGFFVGAYFVNFAVAEGFLFVLLMIFIFWKNTRPDTGVVVPIVIGVVGSVILPIVFYPYARTIWSAIDLAMTPLEVPEIVAAADAVAGDPDRPDAHGPDRPDPHGATARPTGADDPRGPDESSGPDETSRE
ncbi:MAG: DUF983 domain-containing protein [Acidimicrobiales bacterium]